MKHANVRILIQTLREEFQKGISRKQHLENVSTLMEKFQFDEEQWISLAVFQEATYSRILLHTNNDFSVFLLCWKPQQKTPIHGHAADNHAWIRVMAGRLSQTLYAAGEELTHFKMTKNSGVSRVKGGNTQHCVQNDSDSDVAISLHVYFPTYIECAVVEDGVQKRMPIVFRDIAPEAGHCSTSPIRRLSGDVPLFASLDELVSVLRAELAVEPAAARTQGTIDSITRLLENYRFNEEEWAQYASYKATGYTRNLIGYDQKFTLLLLCWASGQKSPIHDHSQASCWMKILSGHMRETRYAFPGDVSPNDFGRDLDSAVRSGELHVTKTTDLQREQAAYIDDSQALHRMENANATMPAVSLHIYSPPFHQCRVFDEHSLIGREVSIGCANAAKNPFVHTDMRASSEPSFGGHLQLPPASPEPLLPPPTSVPELVAQLRNVFRDDMPSTGALLLRAERVCQLVSTAKLAEDEWNEYVHFSEHRFQRILLAFDENFSLVLNCWRPGQATPEHSHAERHAWIRVVAGQLALRHFTADSKPLHVDNLSPKYGCQYYSAAAIGQHTLGNETDNASVSLHVYHPPMLALSTTHEEVPVVVRAQRCSATQRHDALQYCAKALAPTADSVLARATQSVVFGSLQTFVGALRQRWSSEVHTDCPVATLLDHFHFQREEWQAYARSSVQNNAARLLVGLGEHFSVVVRFWTADQQTAPHSHGESRTWIKVLDGAFDNVVYSSDTANGVARSYTAGASFSIDDPTTVHAIKCRPACNDETGASAYSGVTLHVFSPPLSENLSQELLVVEAKK